MPKLAANISAGASLTALARASAALDLGFDAVVVAAPIRETEWQSLKEMLPRDATASVELFLPFPASLRPGAPSPFQAASLDPEERRAALKQGLCTLIEAERKNALMVHIPPIALDAKLRDDWLSLRRGQPFFEERQAQILSRRATEATRRLEALKSLLGRLLESAERYGRQIAIVPGGFPDELPSPRETEELLREFRGAPLTVWVDTLRVAACWPGDSLGDWPLRSAGCALTLRDFDSHFASTPLGDGALQQSWAVPLLEAASLWALDEADSRSSESLSAGLLRLRTFAEPPKPKVTSNWLGI